MEQQMLDLLNELYVVRNPEETHRNVANKIADLLRCLGVGVETVNDVKIEE